jgi:hypothetical protein
MDSVDTQCLSVETGTPTASAACFVEYVFTKHLPPASDDSQAIDE